MEINNRHIPSLETVFRAFENLLLPEDQKKPLVAAFYLTFACNARCSFCSQLDFVGGNKEVSKPDLETQLKTLELVRREVPSIYLLGGEPTVHPHFEELLAACRDLDFDVVGVNTNAVRYVPEILDDVNMLVVSLYSTDPERVGASLGLNELAGQRVISNVARYAHERDPKRTQMVVNKVVTGGDGDIDDAYRVANFCTDLGVSFNIAPAIMPDGRPDPRLIDNPAYQQLIDDLMMDSRLMACTPAYLQRIRNFEEFACVPNVVPGIHPNGDLVVPCPNVHAPRMVNILETGGVLEALRLGRESFGPFDPATECADKCHKLCYIESANLSSKKGIIDYLRQVFQRKARFFAEIPADESGNCSDEVVEELESLVDKYMSDLHRYDFLLMEWVPLHNAFSGDIEKLSDGALLLLQTSLEEVVDFIEMRWKVLGEPQRFLAMFADIVNGIFTRPFVKLLGPLEDFLKIGIISDFCGGRTVNRLRDYLKRIGAEFQRRQFIDAKAA